MRSSLALVSLASLVACGEDAPTGPDAQVFPDYDFTCTANAQPVTATETVTVSGTAQEIVAVDGTPTIRPLADVTMVACRLGTEAGGCMPGPTTMTTSGPDGAFVMGAEPTGGVPFDAYLRLEHFGHRTSYLYPHAPLIADNIDLEVPMMLNAFVAQLAALGLAQDMSKSILGIQVNDCAGLGIADSTNVVLSITQDGVDVVGTTVLDASVFSGAFGGAFFVMNTPAGATTVSATYKGMPLRGHTVVTLAGTSTLTELRPGF